MKTMKRTRDSGNAMWLILIVVVLMALLTMLVSRSSDTTEQSGDVERGRIAASEIMRYAKGIEQAVTRMRLDGTPENDVSFEVSGMPGYANPNCAGDSSCLVFDRGGGQSYKAPSSAINDGTNWIVTGNNDVTGVGTAAPDLVLILPNVAGGTCTQINRMLDVAPAGIDSDIDFTPYAGVFTASKDISGMGGKKAGCQDNTGGTYGKFFYQVLIVR